MSNVSLQVYRVVSVKLTFVGCLLGRQYKGVRAKIGRLGSRIIFRNRAKCLPLDYYFSELAL